MKNYKPKYIDQSHLVDGGSIFKKSCKILFSFILLAVGLSFCLNLLVGVCAKYFSVSTARYIGEVAFSSLFKEAKEVDSSTYSEVYQTFDELIKDLPEKEHLSLKIIEDASLKNAFALPGGTIAITTSLINTLNDKHEIAMILAHEIGHQINRDPLKSVSIGLVTSMFLLMINSNGDSTNMPKILSDLLFLSNSREQELSADNFALNLMLKTYNSPKGVLEAFEKLLTLEVKEHHDHLAGLDDIFSTHPDTRLRLENLQLQIKKNR